MCNGILNDPRVLCQHFFAEFITKHIFRVLSPNQPLYQELNMRWDERYNMHRKTFTFIPTCIPIRLKDGTQEFLPTAHRRGDLQFFMKYQHFGKSLVAPTSASLRPPKPSSWQQNVLGNGKRLGLCFNRLIFLLMALLGPHGRLANVPIWSKQIPNGPK